MSTTFNSVRLATIEYVDLTTHPILGTTAIDSVLLAIGDRILVKAQTNKTQNGIYTITTASSILSYTRASDFLAASTQTGGSIVFVQEGTNLADTGWVISSNGNLIVGTDNIEFERFSANLKLSGIDAFSSMTYRKEKGFPLTNDELDANFKYLSIASTLKLNSADFNAITVRDRLNSLSSAQANINAWKLQGSIPDVEAIADTLALRDSLSDLTANIFHGDLNGNADTATLADFATLAGNVTGIVQVLHGGTGSSTAPQALINLGALPTAGGTMTGGLTLKSANLGSASLNIPALTAIPSSLINGDVWSGGDFIYYRMSGVTHKIAQLDSPVFTGGPTSTTADVTSDSTIIATTAFVQTIRRLLDASIALKANINSPTLTGTPASTTPEWYDNSTRIATTAYTVAKINNVLANYYTSSQINLLFSNYSTTTSASGIIDAKIAAALNGYATTASVDNTLTGYATNTAVGNAVNNGIAGKADAADLGPRVLWLESHKANIDSPQFTGAPFSTAPMIWENSNRIATTAYVVSKIEEILSGVVVDPGPVIGDSLANYYTKTQTDGRINSALISYYTSSQINSLFTNYSTTGQVGTMITNGIAGKANITYVDGLQDKWGTSKKYVQSSTPSSPAEGDIWFKV